MMKIGFAKDIHKLYKKTSRPLVLGGLEINHKWKIKAHSDGDIIIHAICSALLGALAKPTLGELYPDDAISTKDMSSIKMLSTITRMMKEEKYHLACLDLCVVCEKIILKPYLENIKQNLIQLLNNTNICIKATRFENPRKKYIECYCSLILEK